MTSTLILILMFIGVVFILRNAPSSDDNDYDNF